MGLPNFLAALIPVSITTEDPRIQTNSGFTLKQGLTHMLLINNRQEKEKRQWKVKKMNTVFSFLNPKRAGLHILGICSLSRFKIGYSDLICCLSVSKSNAKTACRFKMITLMTGMLNLMLIG